MDISAIITRASNPGLQLLEDLLKWDAEKRPSAQQALKYPYFQIIKRLSSTQNLANQMAQAQTAINGRKSNMSFTSMDHSGETENNKQSNTDSIKRSYVSMAPQRESSDGSQSQKTIIETERSSKDLKLNVLNGMFNNVGIDHSAKSHSSIKSNGPHLNEDNNSQIETSSLKKNGIIQHENGIQEKINDIYVNRNIGQLYSNVSILNPQPKTILMYNGNGYSSKGFYLHRPAVVNNNGERILADTKVYNAFSKQRDYSDNQTIDKNGSNNYSSLNLSSVVRQAKQTPVKKWSSDNMFEDDELANILG